MAHPSSTKAFEAALARKAAMQAARCAGAKGPSAKGIGPKQGLRAQRRHSQAGLETRIAWPWPRGAFESPMHGDFFTTRRAVGLWAEMRVN